MSAAIAEPAKAINTAVPSKSLFIGIPLIAEATLINNLAPIWLRQGDAEALIVRKCDGPATKRFCSMPHQFFANRAALPHHLVDAVERRFMDRRKLNISFRDAGPNSFAGPAG
jgi:hypothetical protein